MKTKISIILLVVAGFLAFHVAYVYMEAGVWDKLVGAAAFLAVSVAALLGARLLRSSGEQHEEATHPPNATTS